MAYLAGDIICLRTTGERVCVLGSSANGEIQVRRPVILETGAITHKEDSFFVFELESLREHGDRQIAEMLMKAEAQKQLIQAENKMQTQLAQEEDDEILKPQLVKKEPVLN